MHSRVLKPIVDPQISVFVAWAPILAGDNEAEADQAMRRLPDRRASHYWDDSSSMQAFRKVLDLPEGTPAWDLYMVFDPDVRWSQEPPAPGFWMHQLDVLSRPRLDGDALAEEIRRRIDRL